MHLPFTAAGRVARGARLLDRKNPGWTAKVNLVTLDIRCPLQCILGQVYGSWSEGLETLGIHYADECLIFTPSAWCGFSSGSPKEDHRIECAWGREIARRT